MIDSERKIMAGWSQLSSETKHSKKNKKKNRRPKLLTALKLVL